MLSIPKTNNNGHITWEGIQSFRWSTSLGKSIIANHIAVAKKCSSLKIDHMGNLIAQLIIPMRAHEQI